MDLRPGNFTLQQCDQFRGAQKLKNGIIKVPLSLWAKRDRHANARNLTGSDQTTAVYNEYAASLTSVNLCQSGPFSEGEIPIRQMSILVFGICG